MDYIKLTFYLMIIMSIGTYIFGLTTDSLVFAEMDYKAWILSVTISLIITLGAVPLFQVGVRCEGASTAGIVSAFEPSTSIILGAIFLGETRIGAVYRRWFDNFGCGNWQKSMDNL